MEIIDYSNKKNTIVLLDESFIEFVDPALAGRHAGLFREYKNLFILRSLTKFFAIPGLRLGYALCFNRDIVAKIKRNTEPWTVNLFADLAGRVLLSDSNYIERSFKLINRERDYLFNGLRGIEWLKPFEPAANFILVKILNGLTASGLKEKLIRHKILIRDASNFKFLNNEFVRIAVKDRKKNSLLIKKLLSLSS
jgi:threonine-phosphate decarboxylase